MSAPDRLAVIGSEVRINGGKLRAQVRGMLAKSTSRIIAIL
jgi:hypothetical protein